MSLIIRVVPMLRYALLLPCLLGPFMAHATNYYIDADGGSDVNAGTSPAAAWASLAEASSRTFLPGDQILLQAGDLFPGKLLLDGDSGTASNPIVIDAYGTGLAPVIDAAGHLAGIHLRDTQHVTVRNLEITADGGATVDGSTPQLRYGVFIDAVSSGASSNTIQNLYIHDIFPEQGSASEGATPTTYKGTAIAIHGTSASVQASYILVENCTIATTGFKAIELKWTSYAELLNNTMSDIGGPAIQPGRSTDLVVRGNVVDGSGSFSDWRMHGRGSGIWPWSCERVLIERNQFMHARGRGDSCGMHIDFNCRDVVVQYNLSVDNAGGFVEILGNNDNCTYRYNISINDGGRVKGTLTQGTIANNQDGHTLWTSGYVGGSPPDGPYNSYIYNNTIYVHPGMVSKFSFAETTDGLLIANNIFYIPGTTADITPDADNDYNQGMIDRVVWENNLYQRTGIIPGSFPFTDTSPSIADPLFANTGGLLPEDYIPSNAAAVEDAGIVIDKIPGDALGLAIGLAVAEDFFGNPVIGLPDMGAVEIGGTPFPLPAAAFSNAPTFQGGGTVAMTAVKGPFYAEYLFTETSGNHGGDDSGWQMDPNYADGGLLPNTEYAYTVTLRNVLDEEGAPSAEETVLVPGNQPSPSQIILSENFSALPNPANASVPFPVETWFIAYEDEAETSSVGSASPGKLRIGWGYDRVVVLWYSSQSWDSGQNYNFSGNWEIDNVLDVHLGIVVGIGEFDPFTGELLQRIKETTVGELVSPTVGQSGAFSITLTSAELLNAGVGGTSRVGVFFEHAGDYSPLRNDVYLADNLELTLVGNGPDLDGDGIPDSDEEAAGMNPDNPADASEDWDFDGSNNYGEFLTGTDLNNSNDFFRISILQPAGDSEVFIPGANVLSNRLYILEHATSLDNPISWTAADVLDGGVAGPGTDQVFNLANPDTHGFFRVRVEWE